MYDYVKPKYLEKLKSCYVDTGSFIVYIKVDYLYKDIAEDIETTFDTPNYKFSKGKTKNVITIIKNKLGERILIKFAGLRAKTS